MGHYCHHGVYITERVRCPLAHPEGHGRASSTTLAPDPQGDAMEARSCWTPREAELNDEERSIEWHLTEKEAFVVHELLAAELVALSERHQTLLKRDRMTLSGEQATVFEELRTIVDLLDYNR